ncbi:MAG: chloride channel protein, partial [Planctomycetaceae bacterium]|nr:chloride channel protein [Planctomycetaceae bacterium]
ERVVKEGGDFTAGARLLVIAALAVAVCAGVALAPLRMIELFTNLFYFQRFSFQPRSPAESVLGWLAVLVPVVGGLIVGLMARYGSERIRGHGIPEAMEAILIGRSRMSPKVALLKPVSSAVSIGSGGPFGAEGPIIMTGGSIGSIVAQAFQLTSAERKTLLVAGAAGGMSAVFNTPMAAALLAVELLLFEWKPRSLIPVALAAAVAALFRPYLLGAGPMFPVAPHAILPTADLLASVPVGLLSGALALVLTMAVYGAEDAFHRLPIHWMWWPMIGGLCVGLGGMVQPKALGVGYDLIEDLMTGRYVAGAMVGLLVVKGVIWAVALGSGTSGGVLAPLLIMGGILGALEATVLPGGDRALWPLVSMAATLGGTMRSPLTAVVFALELTHDINALPALLIGSVVAHGFTVLVMKRSILTEKVARRGYHISREYTVDPLEQLGVGEVMTTEVVTIPAALPIREVLGRYFLGGGPDRHPGYPVVDKSGKLLGVITRSSLLEHWIAGPAGAPGGDGPGFGPIIAYDLIDQPPVTAFPWESCRAVAERMAQTGVKRVPIVKPDDPLTLVGIVSLTDLLKSRLRLVEEEAKRERFFGPGLHTTSGAS